MISFYTKVKLFDYPGNSITQKKVRYGYFA